MRCLESRWRVISHYPLHKTNTTRPWLSFPTTHQEEHTRPSRAAETCQDGQPRAQEPCFCTEQVCGQAAGAKPPLQLPDPSQLPAPAGLPLGGEGERPWENLSQAASFCQGRLARAQDCKHLTTANSSEHVNSFDSQPSPGNQKAKDTVVSSLVLWVSAPPRPAARQCPGIRSVGNLH